MGLTKFKMCVNLLAKYMEETGKNYIHTIKLRNLIIKEIGSDENRSVLPNLKMMRTQGLIEEVAIHKWKIKLS